MGNSGNDRRIDSIEFTVSDIAHLQGFEAVKANAPIWRR